MGFYDIERKKDEINQRIAFILSDRDEVFFDKTNLVNPDFKNQEFSFYRLISVLFATYFETGKVGLNIVSSLFTDEEKALYGEHKKTVNYFRTKLQHNLDPSKDNRSFNMQKVCMEATQKACGKMVATEEEEWRKCSAMLIDESIQVLNIISQTLEMTSDSTDKITRFKENWIVTTTSTIEPHYFDRAVEKYIQFLEPSDFDIVKYRSKNLDKWRKYIRDYYIGTDVKVEIERIVQSSIIRDFIHMLPVTLDDLKDIDIISNETFKDIYKYMVQLNSESPHSKGELLKMLRAKYGKDNK